MSMSFNFFNSIHHLEPRCRGCSSKIDYGVTTRYDEEKEAHVCLKCGQLVD